MSYDGIVMRAVALELNNALTGARIDKIYQPTKNEILIHLRQSGQNYRLLLSALAQESAVYLNTQSRTNPTEAPLFCMVLRKHLEGGRAVSVTQQGLERVLEILIESYDDMGDRVQRKLAVEVMGKHSNIVLLDPSSNKIIDSIFRIPASVSSYRQILPGLLYAPPPPQEKSLPWEVQEEEFKNKLLSQPLSQKLSKVLLNLFSGLGPQTCEEILSRASLNPSQVLEFCGDYELNKLWQGFSTAASNIKDGCFTPEVILQEEKPITFSALALTHFDQETRRSFATMNEALDFFYSHRKKSNLFQQKRGDLTQVVKKETDRCEKKAGLQEETIHEASVAERYRLWGELLTANQYHLAQGQEVQVQNYYNPEAEVITIPLEEPLSIMDNAQVYFKKYQKARKAAKQALIHLQETRQELEYLHSLTTSLENITNLAETEEIREELQEAGYIKAPVLKKKAKAIPAKETSKPEKVTMEDWEIYYGKNNKQNDLLTMKLAKSEDTWLHTKDIPGAHVIIKNPGSKPIPPAILETAALLAAYNSKARFSTQVPVDYTQKKNVWKQKGAKPGMVNYDNQRTIYVTPTGERIKEILGT